MNSCVEINQYLRYRGTGELIQWKRNTAVLMRRGRLIDCWKNQRLRGRCKSSVILKIKWIVLLRLPLIWALNSFSPPLLLAEGSESKPGAAGYLCSRGLGTFSWNFHIFSHWCMLSQIIKNWHWRPWAPYSQLPRVSVILPSWQQEPFWQLKWAGIC